MTEYDRDTTSYNTVTHIIYKICAECPPMVVSYWYMCIASL